MVGCKKSKGTNGGEPDEGSPLEITFSASPDSVLELQSFQLRLRGTGANGEISYSISGTFPSGRDTLIEVDNVSTSGTSFTATHRLSTDQAGEASFIAEVTDVYNGVEETANEALTVIAMTDSSLLLETRSIDVLVMDDVHQEPLSNIQVELRDEDLVIESQNTDETGAVSFSFQVYEGQSETYQMAVTAHGYLDSIATVVSEELTESFTIRLSPVPVTLSGTIPEINPRGSISVDVRDYYQSIDPDDGTALAMISSEILMVDERVDLSSEDNTVYTFSMSGNADDLQISVTMIASSEFASDTLETELTVDQREPITQSKSVIEGKEGDSVRIDLSEYFSSAVDMEVLAVEAEEVTITPISDVEYRLTQDATFYGSLPINVRLANIEGDTLETILNYEVTKLPRLSVDVFNLELRAQHINDGIRTVLQVVNGTDSTQYESETGSFTDIPFDGDGRVHAFFVDENDEVASFSRTEHLSNVTADTHMDIYSMSGTLYDENFNVDGKLGDGSHVSMQELQTWVFYVAERSGGLVPFNVDGKPQTAWTTNTWQCGSFEGSVDKFGIPAFQGGDSNYNVPAFAILADSAYLPVRLTHKERNMDERTRSIVKEVYALRDKASWGVFPDIVDVDFVELDEKNNAYTCYDVTVGRNDGAAGATRGFISTGETGLGDRLMNTIIEVRAGDVGAPSDNIYRAASQENATSFGGIGLDSNNHLPRDQTITNDATPLTLPTSLDFKMDRGNVHFSVKNLADVRDLYGIPSYSSNN